MNRVPERGCYRATRGAFLARGVKWEELSMGSTNRLWRGRSLAGDWLFKWYCYPQLGVHPEVEIAEYLARHPEIGVAEFGAKVERVLGAGDWMTLGLVQRWVDGRVAWERVLDDLGEGKADVVRAKSWGRTVGGLHKVLSEGEASGAFGKERWGEPERGEWARRVEGMGERLLGALNGEIVQGVEEEIWAAAKVRWVDGAETWRSRARNLARLDVVGWKSRVHGDLHLGQILETPGGRAIVVDFEGEPLRPLAERREKDLPLRDVAGMWRSFAYAGAVSGACEACVVELQNAFLAGWQEEMSVPEGDWRGVLDGLVWEKAIYEMLYELRHRPSWLGVPLRAI